MAVDATGPLIIGITVMFQVIATVAVALRFWSRRVLKSRLFAHDIWIMIGFICATGLSITLILSVALGGLGQHAVELYSTPWKIVAFQKLLISLQNLWACGMASIRMSILLLYIHLFGQNKKFGVACYVVMIVNALWFVGEMCTVWLICQPAASNWDSSIEKRCGNIEAAYLGVHTSNLIVDLLVAALPAQVLWRLKMPMGRKLGIMAMFALVALICAITIARIALWRIALGFTSSDFTYTGSTLYLFSAIDVSVACALACMPLLKPAGQKLASLSAISWMRTLVRTSQSHSSNEPSGQHGWMEAGSVEGQYFKSHVVAGKNSKSIKGRASDEQGIYVNRRVDQHSGVSNDSFEMN